MGATAATLNSRGFSQAALILHVLHEPYMWSDADKLESRSLGCSLLTLLGGLLFHGLGEMAGTGGTRPAVAWLVSGLVLLANLLVLHKFLRIVLSGVWSILHGPSSSLSRQY